jgi:hypothetical protein
MAERANVIAGRNLVAIDVARYWNAVLIETAAGKRHRFKMANTAADFERLLNLIGQLSGSVSGGLRTHG